MEPFFFLASSFFLRRFRGGARRSTPRTMKERLGDLRRLLPGARPRAGPRPASFFLSSLEPFLSSEALFFFLSFDGSATET